MVEQNMMELLGIVNMKISLGTLVLSVEVWEVQVMLAA
jgi:hypothetical protein